MFEKTIACSSQKWRFFFVFLVLCWKKVFSKSSSGKIHHSASNSRWTISRFFRKSFGSPERHLKTIGKSVKGVFFESGLNRDFSFGSGFSIGIKSGLFNREWFCHRDLIGNFQTEVVLSSGFNRDFLESARNFPVVRNFRKKLFAAAPHRNMKGKWKRRFKK